MAEITRPPVLDETGRKINDNLALIASSLGYLASASAVAPSEMTPAQIQEMVRERIASKYLPVGTQITVPWTYGGTTYDFVWDVLHHYDGSDAAHPLRAMADGTQRPAMCIGAHYCLPIDTQYGPREAAIVAQSAMPAGAYHFSIRITTKWASAPGIAGTVGTRTYAFTTAKEHPAGAQFVWEQGESAQIASAKVYDEPMGTDVSETVAITEVTDGSTPAGADLGTMSENSSTAGLNNPQRTIYGNNDWHDSSLRLFLNETGTFTDSLVTPFHRRVAYDGKAGVLGGFSEDFRAILGHVLNRTQPHPFDGDAIQTTDDVLYLLSAREHAFNNYLSNTTDGYNAEGVPLDYWTQLAKRGGISSGVYSGWQTYPDLITYDLAAKTSARAVWERSAARYVANAASSGVVYPSGTVATNNASHGYRVAPSACIV